jgi:hypothetical protein
MKRTCKNEGKSYSYTTSALKLYLQRIHRRSNIHFKNINNGRKSHAWNVYSDFRFFSKSNFRKVQFHSWNQIHVVGWTPEKFHVPKKITENRVKLKLKHYEIITLVKIPNHFRNRSNHYNFGAEMGPFGNCF